MLSFWRSERSTPTREHAAAPGASTATPSERPVTDALIPRSRRGHYPKVIMTLVLGLDAATLAPLLREMAAPTPPAPPVNGAGDGPTRPPPTRAMEPLLVTDCLAFRLFSDADLIFEYLPGRAIQQRHAADLPWEVYTTRRLERLRHKWAPVRIIAVGAVSREILASQLTSPFASEDLPMLVGGAQPTNTTAWPTPPST